MELDFTEEVQKNSTLQAHGTKKSDRGIPPTLAFLFGNWFCFSLSLTAKKHTIR